ncbi:MAG TPA: hypothetical protein VI757_06115 [Bacteroidia bacterium]|nr:hypothetical protein [Bacteroidia bacterium]
MSKKEEEKKILFMVYKRELFEDTLGDKDETPDFILTDPVNGLKIGVEITTLFTNQASAINKNDRFTDSYIDNHIAESKKGTKKKKKPAYLRVLNVTQIEGDDSLVYKNHVVWQIARLKDYFEFFENIIKEKSKAYEKKVKDLQFVNLIGKDMENYFKPHKTAGAGELYGLLRQYSIFQTIINSNFQEIFLIAIFKEINYSIPLKWLIFQSEYYLFKIFWQEFNSNNKEYVNNLKILLDNFCVCMIHLGYKNIYLNSDNTNRYLYFGTSYWKINKVTNELTEHAFLALNLPDEHLAKNMLQNYKNYFPLFQKYLEFRKERGCVMDEGVFRKLPS